jgi:hypothetical protein
MKAIELDIPAEKLNVTIPVFAPAIIWLGVIGHLQLALRHPQNQGASVSVMHRFARELLDKMVADGILTREQRELVFCDFEPGIRRGCADSITRCPHGFAQKGNCGICRGAQS